MKEQKHEVIVNGELNTEKIEKEHIDAMCRSLLRDILEYYQKHNANGDIEQIVDLCKK